MIDLTRALARFRAFPDDIRLALEGDKPFEGDAGAPRWPHGSGLATGTAGEERPRDVDHMQRAVTRFHMGTVDSKARVSATTRSANFESRTSVEQRLADRPRRSRRRSDLHH